MKKYTALLFAIFLLLGCRTLTAELFPTSTPVPTVTPLPTETATPASTATLAPSPTLELPDVPPKIDLNPEDFIIRTHPDGALYVGDKVSFEVISPPDVDLDQQEVTITLVDGSSFGPAGFGSFGIGGRRQATLQWVWDTESYEAGEYEVTFTISPNETIFTRTVTLLAESLLQYPEPDAAWVTTESDCCLYYYITGTAAERDIDALAAIADREADLALAQIGGELTEPIIIVFLPRVLGHGGFAGGEIYISYLDRNYAGNAAGQVIHHEIIHILDGRAEGNFRPTIFVEGLAVYHSGGHFKQEPIVPRAAALFELGWYIPLDELTEDFYFAQHEVSYLQGAALITFMVETWGYEAFDGFYRSISMEGFDSTAAAIDAALQTHFGTSYAELEAQFTAYLQAQPVDPAMAADMRLSVLFFDSVRRYQQAFDPSAYFLTAWLLGINELLDNGGIVADYVRHPETPENITLELMLVTADSALRSGDYALAEEMLDAVNAVLDAWDAAATDIFYAHPVAADYYALTLATLEAGYTPEIISITGGEAVVWATRGSAELVELSWKREAESWVGE